MPNNLLKDVKVYLDGFDISGETNRALLNYGAEGLDGTTHGSGGTRTMSGGLKTVRAEVSGLQSPGTNSAEQVVFERIGVPGSIITMCPITGAANEPAYTFEATAGEMVPLSGSVGELLPFSFSAEGRGTPLVPMWIMQAATSPISASGFGSIYQRTAVGATQRLYCAAHILSGTGSVTFRMESSAVLGFSPSATSLTLPAMTGVGVHVASTLGTISNTYYRAAWTVTSGGPFTAVILMGII